MEGELTLAITIKMEIPEDLAAVLSAGGRDLSRAAIEALAVEEYRLRRISDAQLRRLLGISRWQADALLKAHGVWLDYTVEDFRREGEATRAVHERSRQ